jgi:hypothetical protein
VKPAHTHEHLSGDDEVIQPSSRSFGLTFAVVFAVVALLPLWRGQPARAWAVVVAFALAGVALVAPAVLAPLSDLWQRVGLLLHRVVNPIVLGALFYLAVTPFGLVTRWFGKGLTGRLRPDPKAGTYWISRADVPPSSMRNQF